MPWTAAVMMAGFVAGHTQYLQRPEGRVAYEILGEDGPLAVCVPGMGDIRGQYRFLVEPLRATGHRVVLMDLRGMGDSDAGFTDYSASAVGGDIVALLDELNAQDATVIGNSMAAAAGVWAAAERPQRVANLVVVGPFVRDVPAPFYMQPLIKVLFGGPWGRSTWMAYYGSLYPSRKPADYSAHQAALSASLARPGHMGALRAMLDAKKAKAEARIPDVRARTLVVMGSKDPDFGDPRAEATLVGKLLHGDVQMVDGAGHYPHAECPEQTSAIISNFLKEKNHETQSRSGS